MIVVTTPTGQIGGRLVRRLLERGQAVRVIVRDPARLGADVVERVEIVQGSHADPASLDKALSGADALFWLIPPDPATSDVHEHYRTFAGAGAEAVRRNGVGHVVGVSSAGHDWPEQAGVLSAAFAMDAELAASGAAYRAVSPPFYMENLLGQRAGIRDGAFSLTYAPDRPLATVSTRDIADTAADLLTGLSWAGAEHLPLFGPDRLSPAGMAEVISQELGRSVEYRPVSLDAFASMRRRGGASEQAVRDMSEALTAQDAGIYDADWSTAKIALTSFRAWCREVLKPAVAADATA